MIFGGQWIFSAKNAATVCEIKTSFFFFFTPGQDGLKPQVFHKVEEQDR